MVLPTTIKPWNAMTIPCVMPNRRCYTPMYPMVALARGLLFDPHWAWTAASVLGGDITPPPQYERAYQFRLLRDMRAHV